MQQSSQTDIWQKVEVRDTSEEAPELSTSRLDCGFPYDARSMVKELFCLRRPRASSPSWWPCSTCSKIWWARSAAPTSWRRSPTEAPTATVRRWTSCWPRSCLRSIERCSIGNYYSCIYYAVEVELIFILLITWFARQQCFQLGISPFQRLYRPPASGLAVHLVDL